MKKLIIMLALSALVAPACTTTGQPDWPTVTRELTLGAQDLRDASTLLDDGKLRDGLLVIADTMDLAAQSGGNPPTSTVEAISAGLDLAEHLIEQLDEKDKPELRVALMLARAGLRRYAAYLPQEVSDGGSED